MKSLFRSFFTVSFYTFLSRVLGFIRDILIARYLGSTVIADAFFVAFRIPNFFRRVLAEGAYSAALIPVFSGVVLNPKDEREASRSSFGLRTTPEKTGINAALYAPSARTRRKKLGIRNATKNASAMTVDPRYLAINMSRIKPNTRLKNV